MRHMGWRQPVGRFGPHYTPLRANGVRPNCTVGVEPQPDYPADHLRVCWRKRQLCNVPGPVDSECGAWLLPAERSDHGGAVLQPPVRQADLRLNINHLRHADRPLGAVHIAVQSGATAALQHKAAAAVAARAVAKAADADAAAAVQAAATTTTATAALQHRAASAVATRSGSAMHRLQRADGAARSLEHCMLRRSR